MWQQSLNGSLHLYQPVSSQVIFTSREQVQRAVFQRLGYYIRRRVPRQPSQDGRQAGHEGRRHGGPAVVSIAASDPGRIDRHAGCGQVDFRSVVRERGALIRVVGGGHRDYVGGTRRIEYEIAS